MKEYLNDLQIAKVEAFCADTEMFEAVKLVLLKEVYTNGVITKGQPHNALKNRALVLVQSGVDDEVLGSQLRALWEGVQAVEGGFVELEKIKSKVAEPVESPFNIAE